MKKVLIIIALFFSIQKKGLEERSDGEVLLLCSYG